MKKEKTLPIHIPVELWTNINIDWLIIHLENILWLRCNSPCNYLEISLCCCSISSMLGDRDRTMARLMWLSLAEWLTAAKFQAEKNLSWILWIPTCSEKVYSNVLPSFVDSYKKSFFVQDESNRADRVWRWHLKMFQAFSITKIFAFEIFTLSIVSVFWNVTVPIAVEKWFE